MISDYLEGIQKLKSATESITYISTKFIKALSLNPHLHDDHVEYYNALTVHANDIISISMGSDLSIFSLDKQLAINKDNVADHSVFDNTIYDTYRNVLFNIDLKGITIMKNVNSSMHTGCQICHNVKVNTDLGYIKLFNEYDYNKFFLLFFIFFSFVMVFYSSYEKIISIKKRESLLDSLTGLLNRNAFDSLKSYKSKQVFCFLDIDHFKSINDTYGHDIGDKAIKAFTHCLNENIRKTDLAFRWGGEEFLLILRENINEELDVYLILERIRRCVEAMDLTDIPKFTVSIGYCYHESKTEIQELVKKADLALYESKKTGRNKVTRYKE